MDTWATANTLFYRVRMMIADENFAQLSLQRTFFGRSLIQRVSFAGTDLSESDLCWNDFEEVGFAHASLQGTDLRRRTLRIAHSRAQI